jgi:hypothetical protein
MQNNVPGTPTPLKDDKKLAESVPTQPYPDADRVSHLGLRAVQHSRLHSAGAPLQLWLNWHTRLDVPVLSWPPSQWYSHTAP